MCAKDTRNIRAGAGIHFREIFAIEAKLSHNRYQSRAKAGFSELVPIITDPTARCKTPEEKVTTRCVKKIGQIRLSCFGQLQSDRKT